MFRVGFPVFLIGLLALASHDARAHDRDGGGDRNSFDARSSFGGVRERVDLARPDPAPDADAEGHLHLLESRGRSAIHVHVKNLDPGATYTVKITKGDQTATLGNLTVISENPPAPPPRCFKSSLTGAQEVPPVETDAKGWGV